MIEQCMKNRLSKDMLISYMLGSVSCILTCDIYIYIYIYIYPVIHTFCNLIA